MKHLITGICIFILCFATAYARDINVNVPIEAKIHKTIIIEKYNKCSNEDRLDVLSPKAEHYQKTRRPNYSHKASNYPVGLRCVGDNCTLSINVSKDKGREVVYVEGTKDSDCHIVHTTTDVADIKTTYHTEIVLAKTMLREVGMSEEDMRAIHTKATQYGNVLSVSSRKNKVILYVSYGYKSLSQFEHYPVRPLEDRVEYGDVVINIRFDA